VHLNNLNAPVLNVLIHRAANDGHTHTHTLSAEKQQNEGTGKTNTGGPWLSYNPHLGITHSHSKSVLRTPNSDFRTQRANKHFDLTHSGTLKLGPELYFASTTSKYQKGWSRWPRCLRRVWSLACWDCGFEFPPRYWCLSVVSVVRCRFLRLADYSSRGVPLSVVCLRRELHCATLNATRQQVQSPVSQQVVN